MIYDCFLFANELDVLDIRLHELDNVVDKFVLVESTITHAGNKKRLIYDENKHLFKKFKHKIIHIIVRDSPKVTLPWIVNDFQFCQMQRGLVNCKDSDTIIFGDVDEIPKAIRVKEWKNKHEKLLIFTQKLHQYFLNYEDSSKTLWYGTRMTSYKKFISYKTAWIAKFSYPDINIPDGGWHLSYMGDIKMIQQKVNNMTHQEFNKDIYNTPEKISLAIMEGKDLFGLGGKFKVCSMQKLPDYVVYNQKKFNKILFKKKISSSKLRYSVDIASLKLGHGLRVLLLRSMKKKLKV